VAGQENRKIVILICAVKKFNMLQLQNADRIEATPTSLLTHTTQHKQTFDSLTKLMSFSTSSLPCLPLSTRS